MKCPFLEEILVRYCTACPVKKMLPRESLVDTSTCETDYAECPIFKDFLAKENKTRKEITMAEIKEKKENLCIWTKAGVIAYRICTSNYDCKNCSFDQALTDASGSYVESPVVVEAIKKLKQLPADQRKCRYMLTGDFAYKLCSNNYECWHCSVDQYVQDMIEANPFLKRKREREQKKEKQTKGFAYREDYYYTPNHFWLKIEGDIVKVGVDDFAVKLIGKIDTVKILADKVFEKEQECLELGSKNRMTRMKLPLSVALIEINEIVKSQPSLITKDPYNLGWLFKIRHPQEIGEFNKGDNVRIWLEKEFDRLHEAFEENVGVTIADGGEIAKDLYERLTDEQWSILVKKFLS